MENTIQTCGSNHMILLLVVIIVALIIWVVYSMHPRNKSTEINTFENTKFVPSDESPHIYAETEVLYDTNTQQKQFFTPWGTVINVDDLGITDNQEDNVIDYILNSNQYSSSHDQWPVSFDIPDQKNNYDGDM